MEVKLLGQYALNLFHLLHPSILLCPAVLGGSRSPWMASTGPLESITVTPLSCSGRPTWPMPWTQKSLCDFLTLSDHRFANVFFIRIIANYQSVWHQLPSWASEPLCCCSREGWLLYCTRWILELLLSRSSTRNVHSLTRRHST